MKKKVSFIAALLLLVGAFAIADEASVGDSDSATVVSFVAGLFGAGATTAAVLTAMTGATAAIFIGGATFVGWASGFWGTNW